MFDLPGPLGTMANLLAVIVGFGGIIFIHELGHFLAAKWAGIRVLAFSVGMGPVALSYRKGLGLRRGSSEVEYRKVLAAPGAGSDPSALPSPTEYRLSSLPLGGYVKMLGQEDINPMAVSDAPDSYQNRPVWKRMVVITAGVVFNLILAAALFIAVFMIGLKTQAPIIGTVVSGSPATQATPIDRDDLAPGLLPEDTILEINGITVRAFNEISTEIAMSRGGTLPILVDRPGVGTVGFEVEPVRSPVTGFLGVGIGPALSTTIVADPGRTYLSTYERFAPMVGLGPFAPGSELTAIDGRPVRRPSELIESAQASGGAPFEVTLTDPTGDARTLAITPERAVQQSKASVGGDATVINHLLGLRGLLRVDPNADPGSIKQGLQPGDVFLRIGDAEYPAFADAMAMIPTLKNRTVEVEVLRGSERVTMDVKVDASGRIGFSADSTLRDSNIVGRPIRVAPLDDRSRFDTGETDDSETSEPPASDTPAHRLIDRPGTRILAIDGRPTGTVAEIAAAIIASTDDAFSRTDKPESFEFRAELELPLPGAPVESRTWTLTRAEVASVRSLGWQMPLGEACLFLFDPEEIIDKADGPVAAVGRGISKSRQTMNQTYLTFLRLFQGTVKIEHLKGPVGIAHLGTQVADQGFVWLLFFLGLVSVNLAVINFLPLPIVDGGQFLMLAYEGIRRKPVPVVFQNVITLAGLALIGAVFLIVTFHDIRALFGG